VGEEAAAVVVAGAAADSRRRLGGLPVRRPGPVRPGPVQPLHGLALVVLGPARRQRVLVREGVPPAHDLGAASRLAVVPRPVS
jgi:hypothetical protein